MPFCCSLPLLATLCAIAGAAIASFAPCWFRMSIGKHLGNAGFGYGQPGINEAPFNMDEIIDMAARANCQIAKSVVVEPIHDAIARGVPICHGKRDVDILKSFVAPVFVIFAQTHADIVAQQHGPRNPASSPINSRSHTTARVAKQKESAWR